MAADYRSIPIDRADFVNDYPDAKGHGIGSQGEFAFGGSDRDIAEYLQRPGFAPNEGEPEPLQIHLVDVEGEGLFLAIAKADEGSDNYPADFIQVKITDWGKSVSEDDVRKRVKEQPGDFAEGVILPHIVLK